MLNIHIEKVRLLNVRHYTEEMVFEFPLDNFVAMIGKNGSGKSTIFKAISLSLYGDDGAIKGERLLVSDMVNDVVEKNLEIVTYLHIFDDEGTVDDNYRVELYYKHRQHQNKLYIFKNDVELFTDSTKKQKYEFLETLLYPRNVYHNVVYFRQQIKDFFMALTDSQQKEIFDAIMDLYEYDDYYDNSNAVLKTLEKQLQEVQTAILVLETDIKGKQESLAQLDKWMVEARADNLRQQESASVDLAFLNTNLENIQQVIDELNYSEEKMNEAKEALATAMRQEEAASSKLTGTIKALTDKEREGLDRLTSEEATALSTKELEIRKAFEEDKTSIDTEIAMCHVSLAQLAQKYSTIHLSNELDEYREQYRQEVAAVNRSLNHLASEFSDVPIRERYKTQCEGARRVVEKYHASCSDISSKGEEQKRIFADTTAQMEKDQAELGKDSPTCPKCLQDLDKDAKAKIEQDIVDAEQKLSDLRQGLLQIKSEFDAAKIEWNKAIDHEKEIEQQLSDELETNNKQRDERKEHLERKLQLLSDGLTAKIEEINKQIEVLETEGKEKTQEEQSRLESFQASLTELLATIENQVTMETSLIKEEFTTRRKLLVTTCKRECDEALALGQEDSKQITETIATLTDQLNALNELRIKHGGHTTALRNCEQTIAVRTNALESLKSEDFSDHESRRTSAFSEIEHVTHQLNEKKLIVTQLNEDIEILNFWKEGFSKTGIKSMLIDMATPHMNDSVVDFLEVVAPGIFTVAFDTISSTKSGEMREKFQVNVIHNIKGTNGYKKLSGGEKRIVDLAAMKSLRSLAEYLYQKRMLNTFYDEILDSLDDDSCQTLGQVLRILSRGQNVSLITHGSIDSIEPDDVFNF